jgi:hypothetical protein
LLAELRKERISDVLKDGRVSAHRKKSNGIETLGTCPDVQYQTEKKNLICDKLQFRIQSYKCLKM